MSKKVKDLYWDESLKPLIKKTKIHKVFYWLKNKHEKAVLSNKSNRDIFTDIYKSNSWNGAESISGQGSDLNETAHLIKLLPNFLEKYQIKTIIDLPCGDFNWMQYLDYDFESYVGVDIVKDIIDTNSIKFGNDKRRFIVKDCLNDNIGEANLLMCRDLLIHFSDDDVKQFFNNIKKHKIKYLLTTHFLNEKNMDISTGQWRPINLIAPPFNLPEPLDYIIENTKMFDGRYSETKVMALWRLKDI